MKRLKILVALLFAAAFVSAAVVNKVVNSQGGRVRVRTRARP